MPSKSTRTAKRNYKIVTPPNNEQKLRCWWCLRYISQKMSNTGQPRPTSIHSQATAYRFALCSNLKCPPCRIPRTFGHVTLKAEKFGHEPSICKLSCRSMILTSPFTIIKDPSLWRKLRKFIHIVSFMLDYNVRSLHYLNLSTSGGCEFLWHHSFFRYFASHLPISPVPFLPLPRRSPRGSRL